MQLRAAFHVHSDWSYDGSWTIPALADFFKQRRYQVLFLTEHDRGFTESRRQEFRKACAASSTDEFLVVPGLEYSEAYNRIHLLTFGDVPFLGENMPTMDTLKAVHSVGGVSIFAHPSRKGAAGLFSPDWIEFLSGIELWNRKTDGLAPSKDAERLLAQTGLPAFCGMDFHVRKQYFPLAMNWKKSGQSLQEKDIVDAIRERRFTAEAFGRPLLQFPRIFRSTLNVAEEMRRPLAAAYRRLRSL